MKNKNLLVISEQCYEKVNRIFYETLKNEFKNIKVIIPYDSKLPAPKGLNDIYEPRPIKNYHPRRSFIKKLSNIGSETVDIYIIESDFHTLNCMYLILQKMILNPKLVIAILTFENIEKDYKKLGFDSLKKIKILRGIALISMNLMEKILGKFINYIITVSEDSKIINEKKFQKSKTIITPLGIDSELFTRHKNTPRDKICIGYMGRIIPQKNAHLVLDAFEILSREYSDIELIFQDPQRYENDYAVCLSKRIKKLLTSRYNIRLVNPLHDQMPHHLSNIDILLVPSSETSEFKEQYGRIIVEGKLCGALVLTSRSGAFPEVNGFADQMFNLNVNDIVELTRKFIEIYKSDRAYFEKRVEASVAHAHSMQSIEKQKSIYLELFQ